MKIVNISDLHMATPDPPPGDVLVCAGDLTHKGRPYEITQMFKYLGKWSKNYRYTVAIPGNHDFGLESHYYQYKQEAASQGITLLNDDGIIIDGIQFWGSPITPWFHNWAFNRYPEDIEPHWLLIPEDTQVLITHGPPRGIMDGVPTYKRTQIGVDHHYRPIYTKALANMDHVGCPTLLERIKDLKQLKLHVFGHIHEGYGQEEHNGVKYVNASIMDADYNPVNKPIVVEI